MDIWVLSGFLLIQTMQLWLLLSLFDAHIHFIGDTLRTELLNCRHMVSFTRCQIIFLKRCTKLPLAICWDFNSHLPTFSFGQTFRLHSPNGGKMVMPTYGLAFAFPWLSLSPHTYWSCIFFSDNVLVMYFLLSRPSFSSWSSLLHQV